jgi:osmotically-inducible protein OsmY
MGEPRAVSPALLPGDSAMNLADTEQDHQSIREIREAIASDKSLSLAAKEVTIVARNGRVWLRGHVTTADERAAIERAARQAAGVMEVHNELVVTE